VWLKPHVVVPALAVWAASAVLLARRESRRRVLADSGALVAGGLLAGAPGVLWLVATGAWPHFLDVFLHWNPAYLADMDPLAVRAANAVAVLHRPWGIVHLAALPLSALALWEASRRSRGAGLLRPRWWYSPAETEGAAAARALLAALYLGWMLQAVGLQKGLDYVFVPCVLLALAVVAAQRWCAGCAFLVWFALTGVVANVVEADPGGAGAWVKRLDPTGPHERYSKHPLADGSVMRLWGRALTEGGTPELRDRVGQYTGIHCGTRWEELSAVADYLRTVSPPLGDGELNCWHDRHAPLIPLARQRPGDAVHALRHRVRHQGAERPPAGQKAKAEQIADAVRGSRQRYVVSDLVRTTWDAAAPYRPESWRSGDPLPVWLPAHERDRFPWNQPVVFRAGRYVVHRIDPNTPLGEVRVPDWDSLGELLKPREPKPDRPPGIFR
jgi:hypothetical protein